MPLTPVNRALDPRSLIGTGVVSQIAGGSQLPGKSNPKWVPVLAVHTVECRTHSLCHAPREQLPGVLRNGRSNGT